MAGEISRLRVLLADRLLRCLGLLGRALFQVKDAHLPIMGEPEYRSYLCLPDASRLLYIPVLIPTKNRIYSLYCPYSQPFSATDCVAPAFLCPVSEQISEM